MRTIRETELPLVGFPCFNAARVQVACSTREGGASTGRYAGANLGFHVGDDHDAVLENRRRLAAAMGAPLGDFVFCRQVHGAGVAIVDDAFRGRGAESADDAVPAADAMVTRSPAVVLAIMVADCVPIALHDPITQTLALVHAGWRGTVAGVTTAAVQAMSSLGCDPADLVALVGPAISRDVYQVGDDVAAAVQDAFGGRAHAVVRPDGTGRYLLDLPGAARLQLADAGLRAGNVHLSGLDTGRAHGNPFFSHRLEGPTGRLAMCARLLVGAGT